MHILFKINVFLFKKKKPPGTWNNLQAALCGHMNPYIAAKRYSKDSKTLHIACKCPSIASRAVIYPSELLQQPLYPLYTLQTSFNSLQTSFVSNKITLYSPQTHFNSLQTPFSSPHTPFNKLQKPLYDF